MTTQRWATVALHSVECCRPRSGLFRLLDNRFLPPPAKVKQTVDDLVLDEGGQFLDLPVNLALRLSTTLKDFLQMPYDYFCPTTSLTGRNQRRRSDNMKLLNIEQLVEDAKITIITHLTVISAHFNITLTTVTLEFP
nr:unnamed protein product [Callosobruchus chinensis]